MSDQAHQARRRENTAWRSPLVAGSAVLAGILVFAGFAVAPYLFKGASLRSEIAEQVRATTGLRLKIDGAVRFDLLPQPHVEMESVHFDDRSGTLKVEAEALQGDVRFLPLLVGRLELASATLVHPRLDIDLDGPPMPSDSTIGRALRPEAGASAPGSQRLGVVTLVGGSARLKSKTRPHDALVQAINVTIDWRNLDAPATVTGAVAFQGAKADVAAWVAQPSSLLRGETSAIALRIHSLPLDLSASGEIASAPTARYRGRITASAPSLAGALAFAGYNTALPAPFANLSLASNAVFGGGTLDLPNLRLQVDDNVYEGTLAYQSGAPRPALSGTLAAEQLSLVPFSSQLPALLTSDGRWSEDRIGAAIPGDLTLDLRISATHLRLPPVVVDDAALSVMTRDSRTEIALVEGKAYGGALKGRASVGVSADGLNVRGTGSLNDADIGGLSWDAFGRQLAAGSLSLSGNLEASGDSAAALVKSLRGWMKGRAKDGEISGVNLGLALQTLATGRMAEILAALHKGHTPFAGATADLQISEGVATVESGSLKGPDALLTVGGKADLGLRRFDLSGAAAAPSGVSPEAASLPFIVGGSFDHPLMTPGAGLSPVSAPHQP